MEGLWFDENPGPVHPNCTCEIEKFVAVKVTGRADGVLVPPEVILLQILLKRGKRLRNVNNKPQRKWTVFCQA
jgi:hypothetical protein